MPAKLKHDIKLDISKPDDRNAESSNPEILRDRLNALGEAVQTLIQENEDLSVRNTTLAERVKALEDASAAAQQATKERIDALEGHIGNLCRQWDEKVQAQGRALNFHEESLKALHDAKPEILPVRNSRGILRASRMCFSPFWRACSGSVRRPATGAMRGLMRSSPRRSRGDGVRSDVILWHAPGAPFPARTMTRTTLSVVVARDEEHARLLLDVKLVEAGLQPFKIAPYTFREVRDGEAIILADGNY